MLDIEKSFIDLVKNKNKRVYFRLGWYVLKNRDYNKRYLLLNERRDIKMAFLIKGI